MTRFYDGQQDYVAQLNRMDQQFGAALDAVPAPAASAAAAAASAAAALASEESAHTSELAAADSATAAAVSAGAAEAAFDAFDDRYLGAKSSAPTTDNDGNGLLTGTLYWDTVLNGGCLRVWAGAAWNTVPANVAEAVAFTPTGGIVANNVQDALVDLDGEKEPTISAGTDAQCWRGDKTWRNFAADVLDTVLAGLSTFSGAAVTAADTVLGAMGKLQAQLSTLLSRTGDAGPVGCRNRLDNSGFAINQLALSGTVTLAAGGHGHDRWKAGAAGCTYTFATAAGLTTLTISAGSLQQVVYAPNVPCGTNTLTLSWSGTSQGKIGAGGYGVSGRQASVSGGANLTVEFGIGTLASPQLELGTVPTPTTQRMYEDDLRTCQRYYCHSFASGVAPYTAVDASAMLSDSSAYSVDSLENNGKFTIQFPEPMWTAPVVTLRGFSGNAAGWACQGTTSGGAATSFQGVVTKVTNKKFCITPSISARQYNIMGNWIADGRL